MDAFLRAMVSEVVARHMTPKATVTHPAGVIVPGDEFMTEKLKDPDYVPYCLVRQSCGRTRRVADGFKCPTCGNHTNYDLTHFNGNVDVQYSTEKGSAP